MKGNKQIVALLAGLALSCGTPLVAATTAITGATIIDGTGAAPVFDGVLIIENERIAAIGKGDEVSIPAGAHEIDAVGKFVIPGIMDTNVHLYFAARPEELVRYEGRYEDIIAEAAQIALRSGVTTVFDSWGPRQPLANVRDAIKTGALPGARIYLAGNIVGMSGPISRDGFEDGTKLLSAGFVSEVNEIWEQGVGHDLLLMTPDMVREKLRIYTGKGVDFVKYLSSDHSVGGLLEFIAFSQKAQTAIVEEVHRAGLTAQAHTTTVETLRMAIEAGVDLVQHCDVTGPVPTPDETIRLLVERKVVCAPLATTERRETYLTENFADSWFIKRYPVMDLNTRNMLKGGVTFALSTDAGVISQDWVEQSAFFRGEDRLSELGKGHISWIKAMVEKGMKPMDALVSATRNVARAYKVDSDLGTLESGKYADILILDADPLEDANNYRRIDSIILGGKIIDRSVLPLKPVITAPRTW